MDILITGLLLGGIYALMAMGLSLQYGVARIMNLANGEMLVVGAFAAFWFFTVAQLSPLISVFLIAPVIFALNWLIYQFMLLPLVKRAKSQGQLEVDSILATFGMSFILVGLMVAVFGGDYFNYTFLAVPVEIFGNTYEANRVVAFLMAMLIGGLLYLWLNHTRPGMAMRAVSVDTEAAGLVGIDVQRMSALAFALGGTVTAIGGGFISTFQTMDASIGILFTMKALIIIIMGGVGDIRGTIVAAIVLGLLETFIATVIDPGLTLAAAYLMFILVLLFRPQGFFGRKPS